MKPPYAIGSVPSLSGHAIAYRWRSLPRVRRHRASKPQGSFERVLPWQITMDQLIFASLSHTHYWYEVDMLKVPAYVLLEYYSYCRSYPFYRLETDNTCFFNMVIVFCIIVTADHTPFYRLETDSCTVNIVIACSIIILRGVCCVYGHQI